MEEPLDEREEPVACGAACTGIGGMGKPFICCGGSCAQPGPSCDGAGRKRRGGVGSGEDIGDERGESTPSGGETMSVVAAARKRGRTLTAASITGR